MSATADSSRASTPVPRSIKTRSPATQLPTPTHQNSLTCKNRQLSRVMSSAVDSPSPLSQRSSKAATPTRSALTPPVSPSTPGNSPLKNRDNIKVIARFRPETEIEQRSRAPSTFKIVNESSLGLAGDTYTYDRVFGPESTQEEVFAYSVKQTVDDLFTGYNGTVLAYGQTGSGKTYTMMGAQIHDSQRGMIPRIADAIFERMTKEQKEQQDDPTEFTLSASYMEIYMEQVRDLLTPNLGLPLMIHEDGVNGVHVRNLTKRYVGSSEELYTLLEKGAQMRVVGSTEMNQQSSRSHAIFQLDLTQETIRDGVKRSKLFLVDLAGSEKVGKTGASGQTFEEAKKINSSLTHLGIVINALTDSKSTHIPYRDSKLTRILQQSLGGNARTSLIVNCSPASYNESETLSTLRFGTRAKKIKNRAHVNSEPSQLDLLKRIEQLTMMNNQHELRSKELELELDLWKTGINKLPSSTDEDLTLTPPPPPPKNVPPTTSPADLKKMIYLEKRVAELTSMLSQVPTVSSKNTQDQPLIKQLEESQSFNGVLLEDLNDKCMRLFEMQQDIDQLANKLQSRPKYDDERVMAIEETLITFTNKVAELENQNHMLQREIKTTRNIAETRQERIKTLEELLKEAQSKVHTESANFEFKLFSLKERLQTARKLSTSGTSSTHSSHNTNKRDNGDVARVNGGNMSKIDEDNGSPFGDTLGGGPNLVVHKRCQSVATTNTQFNHHNANESDESLMSMKGRHTRATSVATSSSSSAGSFSAVRFGLNLNIVKPNAQTLSTD